MTMSHNRGDLTQGMGFWKRNAVTGPVMDHLSARGRFDLAVKIYRTPACRLMGIATIHCAR